MGRGKVDPPGVVTKTTGQAAEPNGKGKATIGTREGPMAPKKKTHHVPDAITFNPGDFAKLQLRGPRFAEHNGHLVEICGFDQHRGTYIVKLPGGACLGVLPRCLTLDCRREDIQEESHGSDSS